jgi:hypothetical protein
MMYRTNISIDDKMRAIREDLQRHSDWVTDKISGLGIDTMDNVDIKSATALNMAGLTVDSIVNSFPVIRGFRGACYVFFTSKVHAIKKIKRTHLFGDALEQQFQSKSVQPSTLRGIKLTSF